MASLAAPRPVRERGRTREGQLSAALRGPIHKNVSHSRPEYRSFTVMFGSYCSFYGTPCFVYVTQMDGSHTSRLKKKKKQLSGMNPHQELAGCSVDGARLHHTG